MVDDAEGRNPRLAVIIAARNEAATIGAQLDALTAQPHPVTTEIVVVDNGSTDATPDIVNKRRTVDRRIRLVIAADGAGAAYARNRGAATTDAEWIAFCDADDVVSDGWVAAICDALEAAPFAAGPMDTERLNPEWVRGSRGTVFTNDVTMFEDVFPVASSCNLAIHRSHFEAHGGFDETFIMGEDTELSMRLFLAGVEMRFVPEAVVHYRYRSTLREVFAQSRRFGASFPRVTRRLRAAGIPIATRGREARRWIWLVRSLPTVRTKAGRARWVWVAGRQIGVTSSWLRPGRG